MVLLFGLALTACVESHAIPGTHDGLLVDGGDVDGGDGDGDIVDAGPPPPSCEPTQCEGATSMFLGETPGCCTADDLCGIAVGGTGVDSCFERDAPGAMDVRCPATSVFGLVNLPGCCARGGKCGRLIEGFLPLGCVPGDANLPIPGVAPSTPMSCTFAGPD